MNSINYIIHSFVADYPFFSIEELQDRFLLKGTYHMIKEHDKQELEDYFDLEISIYKDNYYKNIPIVHETRRISNYHHKFTDGSLCLAIPMEMAVFLKKSKYNLSLFFEKYVVPYLFGYVYYEMYKKMPFGERSHGLKGYIEYFEDVFGLNKKNDLSNFLLYLKDHHEYKGHNLCPCGSEKKIRDCHKFVIFHFFNSQNETLINEIRKYFELKKK